MSAHAQAKDRLLVYLPKWVGDVVMITPTLRALRELLPGVRVVLLMRPALAGLLGDIGLYDEAHLLEPKGALGTVRLAREVRAMECGRALLLRNSFSSAWSVFLARVPERIGYSRDGRGALLTRRVEVPRARDGRWQIVSLTDYYWNLAARTVLEGTGLVRSCEQSQGFVRLPAGRCMELGVSAEDERQGEALLEKAGVASGEGTLATLIPGANSEGKRWPAERFASLARELVDRHGFTVLVNGGPAERELASFVASEAGRGERVVALPALGGTLGSLKALLRRSRVVVSNDTGPRHMAAAVGAPLVSLFGPTDPRWADVPVRAEGPEEKVLADPTLPSGMISNDHPERCAMSRIEVERVVEAVDVVLARASLARGASAVLAGGA